MTRAHCQRCEELEEQLHQMRAELAGLDQWEPPHELGLTLHEAVTLATLMRWRRAVDQEALWQVTRTLRGAHPDAFDRNTIQVRISHIRRKLRPYGLTIDTVWAGGWRLPPDTRRRLANWDRERAAA